MDINDGKELTDEELEAIPLLDCPSCDSHNTSVRKASNKWWYIGCMDCDNKRMCDKKYLPETIDAWTKYALRVLARRGESEY